MNSPKDRDRIQDLVSNRISVLSNNNVDAMSQENDNQEEVKIEIVTDQLVSER